MDRGEGAIVDRETYDAQPAYVILLTVTHARGRAEAGGEARAGREQARPARSVRQTRADQGRAAALPPRYQDAARALSRCDHRAVTALSKWAAGDGGKGACQQSGACAHPHTTVPKSQLRLERIIFRCVSSGSNGSCTMWAVCQGLGRHRISGARTMRRLPSCRFQLLAAVDNGRLAVDIAGCRLARSAALLRVVGGMAADWGVRSLHRIHNVPCWREA